MSKRKQKQKQKQKQKHCKKDDTVETSNNNDEIIETSNYHDEIIELCNNYNFSVVNDETNCYATGIGDILYIILGIKNKVIHTPAYINLHLFTDTNFFYNNPVNAFEFRLQLLTDILESNDIPKTHIVFTKANPVSMKEPAIYFLLHLLSLNVPKQIPAKYIELHNTLKTNTYIIFHTKMRHFKEIDYILLKEHIRQFSTNFKTTHCIIIMGEKDILKTGESAKLNMQSCYNELLNLANNNTIMDMTMPIFDLVNYDNYLQDIHIIANAITNISFGGGGSFCTAMTFGKSTYAFYPGIKYNPEVLAAHDAHIYTDYNKMIKDIEQRFSSSAGAWKN